MQAGAREECHAKEAEGSRSDCRSGGGSEIHGNGEGDRGAEEKELRSGDSDPHHKVNISLLKSLVLFKML